MLKSFLPKFCFPKFFPVFSFVSKSEKIMKRGDKDLTKIQTVQEQLKEDHRDFLSKDDVQKFRPLSEAPYDKNTKKFGYKFLEDKKKLNKILRDSYKATLTLKPGDIAKALMDENDVRYLPESTRENLRKIEEIKQFNKVFYRKNELIRLLRKQELMPENFLPINALNNDIFLIDLQKRFNDYKTNLNTLKNNRINNLVFHSNENRKLALLLESGLLDNEKNINEVITKSVELIRYKKNEDKTMGLIEGTKEITILEGIRPEDFETDKELYSSMIKNMGFKLDENLTQYDFEKLAIFFESIVKVDKNDNQKLIENLHLIKKIKSFEEFLFDKFVNNALDIRVKRRAEFKHMTEKESLNYVKYNIENVEETFLMFDNSKEIRNPVLISSMVQKISLFKLKTHFSILHVINDKRYGALLRYITNSIHLLENKDFVNTIWALAKIHKDEKGLIHHRIFKVLIPRISQEIFRRIPEFTVEEFSFLCRGLINLPMLDLLMSPEFSEEIFNMIEKKIDKTNNIFSFQGFNLFLGINPTEKSLVILQKSLATLKNNNSLLEALDEQDIMDLCHIYSTFLNKTPDNEIFINNIRDFFLKINNTISSYVEKFSIDDVGSLILFFAQLNLFQRDLILNLRKKMLDSLKFYEKFRDFSLSKINVALAFFDYNQKISHFQFHINYFFESMMIISLFPGELHKPSSPKYIPFSEIAKIIETNKQKIGEKWLVSNLFILASINFQNEMFFESMLMYFIEEKPTEDLETLSYLALIANNLQLSTFSRNMLKERLFNTYESQLKEKRFIDPSLAARLVYIFNVIYKDLDHFEEILNVIKNHFKYFSKEFLILVAWSFTQAGKKQENHVFLKEITDLIKSQINISQLRKNPFCYYLCNQISHLTDYNILSEEIADKNVLEAFYKIIQSNIEEIEFYKGKRFNTKLIKNEIKDFLNEGNLIDKIEFFSNSNIKIDFLLKHEKKVVNVYSDEHYYMGIDGKQIIKPIFQNDLEMLRKEGYNVIVISSKEYMDAGMEYKKIENEKKVKRLYLKNLLKPNV